MRVQAAARLSLEYKWLVFLTIAVGTFVSVLDQTSVNLALPRIAEHFSATIPAVQWVALGYILTTGSLLLPMGRLSDIIGRKRVYLVGFLIFSCGAALAGSSNALITVVLFKVLQGVGAAMVQATSMAIVTSAFPGSERGKVIGLFMTVVGMGAIAGPIVGGTIVGAFGWRYVFFMGLPFGVASIVASLLVLREPPAADGAGARRGFDFAGAGLSSAALVLFLLVMTNAYRLGWGSPQVVAGFIGVAALLAAFIWRERTAREPMLALELFSRRLFSLGSAASFLSFLAGTSVFFLMPFYLQEVLGYTPGQAGMIIAPTAFFFASVGPIAGRLSDRFGWRWFVLGGLVVSAASLLLLSRLTESAPLFMVMAALVMQGVGMGAFYSPNASAVLSTVEPSRYGVATAFVNLTRNAASVTGVGVATTIVTMVMASQGFVPSLDAVASGAGGDAVKTAFTDGLRLAYLVMFGFLLLAVGLSAIRAGETARKAVEGEPEQPAPTKV